MNIEVFADINDVEKLKEKIFSFAKDFSNKEQNYKAEIKILNEQIKSLQDRLFGKKTEKIHRDDDQIYLFEIPEPECSVSEEPEEITVPSHNRKKKGRKPLPENLPQVEVIHDLTEEEKLCGCGCIKSRCGQEISEQLEIIPAQMKVIKNIRYKYVCKNCEGVEDDGPTISIARMPEQMIPKSMATPGLLAHILTAKFADALPFYRQEKQFNRIGVELPRSTMCSWAMKVAQQCEILMEFMQTQILKSPVINIDETTVQVLKVTNRSKCYMWVFKGGTPDKQIILFQYHPTRSGDVASDFLNGYQGIVQTDGYGGYDFLDKASGIIHVGCWIHSRRKFVAVTKAAGIKKGDPPTGNACTALKYISKLYKIEKEARELDLSAEDLYKKRQEEAVPILDEFKKWLDARVEKIPPKSLLGKAIGYTLNQWHRLIQYTKDGRVGPDNNVVENAIRPFVVGRKNWLFNCTPEGASASACIYSLIETAKANGLEPYWYLKYLFENLPEAMTADEFIALMPQNVDKTLLEGPPAK
ncbi:IS66 family transposase [Desulfobacula toluolica]|uniref:Transposase, IS66 family n=1 Tax=Desulfobacula toluolica (strain DSM 7467 / Tol2) TaxID=651182 RepID=K0N8K1_DESTT|nr:IS66 family transposase [Desulfobacula toluolica]CCK80229.1 transposase, IS66 family [Desulfobacula toluolica Tol2]